VSNTDQLSGINIDNHQRVVFAVSDSGIGIKEEDQSKLFRFFGKVGENNEEINPQGIGLGLTICNKVLN
jgi:hypothetical protein